MLIIRDYFHGCLLCELNGIRTSSLQVNLLRFKKFIQPKIISSSMMVILIGMFMYASVCKCVDIYIYNLKLKISFKVAQ